MNARAKTAETITADGEIVTTSLSPVESNSSLAVSLARAEIDMQVTTAHAFPRSVDRAVKNIMSLATLDEQTSEECVYALPRSGKAIKGPSIRFAEIIQSQWGNCRVGARVVHVDRIEKYVEAEGVFHDLETNAATTARVRRRISDSKGKLYNEDMIVVTGNAACSIAKRNAILGGVPKAAYRKAYDAVEQVIAGDVKTLTERRERAMKAFAAFGVSPERVFAALSLRGIDDITLDHMTTLTGMHAALKSGEATVEEMFKTEAPQNGAPKDLNGKLDALAGKPGTTQTQNDATGQASSGEAAEAPVTAASPPVSPQTARGHTAAENAAAADQASPQSTSPVGAATDAAPENAQKGSQSAQPGAATQWPADKAPANEAEYAEYSRSWFAEVGQTMTVEAAVAKWKEDKKHRNRIAVGEDARDALKVELDRIVAAVKKAA